MPATDTVMAALERNWDMVDRALDGMDEATMAQRPNEFQQWHRGCRPSGQGAGVEANEPAIDRRDGCLPAHYRWTRSANSPID